MYQRTLSSPRGPVHKSIGDDSVESLLDFNKVNFRRSTQISPYQSSEVENRGGPPYLNDLFNISYEFLGLSRDTCPEGLTSPLDKSRRPGLNLLLFLGVESKW